MRYAYPCSIVRDEEEERATGRVAYTVTFPDVYGANTGGWSWEEALEMAGIAWESPSACTSRPVKTSPHPALWRRPGADLSGAHRRGETGPLFGDA